MDNKRNNYFIDLICLFLIIFTITISIFSIMAYSKFIKDYNNNIKRKDNINCSVINIPKQITMNVTVLNNEISKEDKNNTYFNENIPLNQSIQQTVYDACLFYSIEDINLIFGLIQCESNFNEKALSSKNCYGLMQLNPKYFPSNLCSEDNVWTGVKHFSYLIDKYDGNIPAALRAYNKGYDDGKREYSNKVLDYADYWRNLEI